LPTPITLLIIIWVNIESFFCGINLCLGCLLSVNMEDGTHFVLVHKIEVFVLLGWKVAQKNTFDSYFPNPCCHDDILAILSCDTM